MENASGNFVKVVQRIPVKILLDRKQLQGRPLFPGLSVVPTIDLSARPAPCCRGRPTARERLP